MTTELEMRGALTGPRRAHIGRNDAVVGDPTADIAHTLDTRAVWRRGACHWVV